MNEFGEFPKLEKRYGEVYCLIKANISKVPGLEGEDQKARKRQHWSDGGLASSELGVIVDILKKIQA